MRSNIGTVYKLRQISDELCAENGLIVIDKTFKNIRKRMKDLIDRSINEANSFYEFLELMQKRQYEIRYDEHLSFRLRGYDKYFRVDTLGTAYKDIAIHRRCANHTEVENKRIQPYMKHFTPSTHKSRLKSKIDWGMRECKSFDELLEYLKKQGIEVKQGKHLAIKPKDGQRFRRIEDNSSQKEIYRIRNYKEIYKYQRAEAVLNHYKLTDHVLLDLRERNQRVRRHNENMEEYKKKLQDAQDDLRQYEILYENLRYIAGEKAEIEKDTPKIEEEERTTKRSYNYWDR